MRTVAICQARMGSTRAPGKVMRGLGGKPVLRWTLDALRATEGIDRIILATTTEPADDVIVEYCQEEGIDYYRGSENDVLDRYYKAASHEEADVVLRLTCDCPFLDPKVIGEVIKLREVTGADYASNVSPPTYPDGLDVECFTFTALKEAHAEATRQSDRECVTQWIVRNGSRFKIVNATCPVPGLAKERWVLDTEDDYHFCCVLVSELPHRRPTNYLEILRILNESPSLREFNANGIRNERFLEDVSTERLPEPAFVRSQKQYDRAARTIPFAAQTFSKSHLQYPVPFAPLFVSHGDGAKIFDIDGNGYVDMVSGLLPVVLGYRDPDVDEAVRRQLDKGITFSLSTEIEAELAELLVHHIPCAEMVKFGKSGSDVTTAAVRLARAYTGKDEIIFTGGYHGWHDWAVAHSGRDLGVPDALAAYSRVRSAEDLVLKETYLNSVAAIILEPNDLLWLREIRELCDKHGIVLIFDEVITGFRYSMGGAQGYYGVTPDLACFGKAMANGMPISALVGKREIMEKMQPPDNIFYSGTMFGECLSIAAAIATIKKLDREGVLGTIGNIGSFLMGAIQETIAMHKLHNHIKISGHPSRSILTFANDELKTLFMIEMLRNGVLIINSNNINWAHRNEMQRITTAYARTLETLAEAIHYNDVANRLNGAMVSPSPLRAAS